MALSDTWFSVTHPAGRRSGGRSGWAGSTWPPCAMRGPPGRWKRALIGPRGLADGDGADTARSGIAERAMRCDSIMRVCTLFGSVAVDDDARLRGADDFRTGLFGESAEVPGHVGRVDGAAELGLTSHLVDPFDLAELFPRRGHQLLLLGLHDRVPSAATARWRGSRFSCIQPGRAARAVGTIDRVPRRLPARRKSAGRAAGRARLSSPATAH